MKSWRTTVGGVGAIFGGLAVLCAIIAEGRLPTVTEIGGIGTALATGYGLIAARDNKVTSEAAGLKPVQGRVLDDDTPESVR